MEYHICPFCGTRNPDTGGYCLSCGKSANSSGEIAVEKKMPERNISDSKSRPIPQRKVVSETVNPEDVKRGMKYNYSDVGKEKTFRIIEQLQKLLKLSQNPTTKLKEVFDHAAWIINRIFEIKEVAIGVKNFRDGLFRYEALYGYRKETEMEHRKLAYTLEDFFNSQIYKGTDVSKYTQLFLTEDHPYAEGEKNTYNRPLMLEMKRRTVEDSQEGDYLDIHIFGPKNELIGWIEISGTKLGKLPDSQTIMWIELIGSVLGTAIMTRTARRRN